MENEQVVKYNVTDAAIQEMSEMYLPLTITDLEDKEQFDAVHSAHMVVKGKRIEVDKKRKELKADALAWGRKVQDEANRIFALIEPIESHLKAEKDKVAQEKQRIEDERIAKIKDEINSWEKAYQEISNTGDAEELSAYVSKLESVRDLISPELYFEFTGSAIESCNNLLTRARRDLENFIRLEAEEAERKAEAERLAEEQAKLKAEQEKIEQERYEVAEAQRKIDEEKAELERAKKAEQEIKDREEFERKAKIEAEEKAAWEAKEKVAREKRESEEAAAEAERQKALLPDKEKLVAFSQFLYQGIDLPKVESENAKEILQSANTALLCLADSIYKDAQNL